MSATFHTSEKSVGYIPSLKCSANFQPKVSDKRFPVLRMAKIEDISEAFQTNITEEKMKKT